MIFLLWQLLSLFFYCLLFDFNHDLHLHCFSPFVLCLNSLNIIYVTLFHFFWDVEEEMKKNWKGGGSGQYTQHWADHKLIYEREKFLLWNEVQSQVESI